MLRKPRTDSQMALRSAFTLIEVLLVLMILIVIISIVTPRFFGAKEQADIDAAKVQIGTLKSVFDIYRLRTNRYPNSLEELWEEPTDSELAEEWGGPYLDEPLKPDPWGNPYQYTAEGKHNTNKYDLWSNGPDGKTGTDDDIGNWEDPS